MRNILALGLASMVAADDVLSVEVTVDNAEVHRGETVTFTCGWKLDNAYGETISKSTEPILITRLRSVRGGTLFGITRG